MLWSADIRIRPSGDEVRDANLLEAGRFLAESISALMRGLDLMNEDEQQHDRDVAVVLAEPGIGRSCITVFVKIPDDGDTHGIRRNIARHVARGIGDVIRSGGIPSSLELSIDDIGVCAHTDLDQYDAIVY